MSLCEPEVATWIVGSATGTGFLLLKSLTAGTS